MRSPVTALQPRPPQTKPRLGSGAFWLIVFSFSTLKAAFLLLAEIDLFSEEAQYWLWGKYPALVYYSKPPLIAWINLLSSSLLGDTEFAVRINALLCGLLSSWFIYRLTLIALRSKRKALIAVILLNCLPFFWIHTLFFTTDSLLLAAWPAALYYLWQAWQQDRLRDWLGLGIAFGLGLLAKYSMLLLLPVLLILMLYDPPLRRNRGLALALLLAFLLFLPAIWGLFQIELISLKHLQQLALGKESGQSLLHPNFLAVVSEYIGGQLLILLPLLPFSSRIFNSRRPRLLLLCGLPALLAFGFFLLLAFHKRPELNWPDFAYLGLPVLAVSGKGLSLSIRNGFAALLSCVLMLLILLPALVPGGMRVGLLPPKADPLRRLMGWEAMADKVQAQLARMPAETLLMTADYHVASQLAFYLKRYPVYCLPDGRRRMNQFDLWPGPVARTQRPVLWLNDSPLPESLTDAFPAPVRQEEWPVYYRGQLLRTYYLYVFPDFYGIEEAGFRDF